MAKLFISYSRKNSNAAHKLMTALEKMGHTVWVDWESIPPASDWLEQIFRGIEESDAFIFLVSPYSIKSEVCNVEVKHAALNNKRIIPIVLKEVPPKDPIEIIRKLNWIFVWPKEKYSEGLKKIKEAIEVDFEWVEEHSRLQERALDWDRKKDPSLLLRGGDLRSARKAVEGAKGKEPFPTELQNQFIQYSIQGERRSIFVWTVSALTVLAMAGLAFYAFNQRDLATENAVVAENNRIRAEEQAQIAKDNASEANKQRDIAEQQKEIADEQKLVAQAQRSAARAQIYQAQPGELYTSTLMALASWETSTSDEAEEILRKNISLLPVPVQEMHQEGGINSLEFNPAGDKFVTGGADGKACVWKTSNGEMIFCTTSPKSVNDAVFNSDGSILVVGDSSGEVQIVRVPDRSVLFTYNAGSMILDVDIGNAGKDISVTQSDGTITILELATGKRRYDLHTTGQIRSTTFSPNGVYFAAGSTEGVVTLWNLEVGGDPITSGRHKGKVLALAFSPNNRYLVSGGEDGKIVTALTTTGEVLYSRLHEDAVTDIAFNPRDSSWFATVSEDRKIRLWDTTDGDERLRMSQDGFVRAVVVSENGQWLATTGADRTVRIWNAATGTEMFQIPIPGEGTVLGFGGDGSLLVAGDTSGAINIWDISVMPAPESYLQFNDLVGDVQFSPFGDWLAVSAGNRVWLLRPDHLPTQTAVSSSASNLTVTGNATNLVFSPDSNWLGISTDAGYVLVYHLLNHTQKTFTSSGTDRDIAFSPDSAYLLVSQDGGSVDAWDMQTIDMQTIEQIVAFAGGSQDITSIGSGPSQIALGFQDGIDILNEAGERVVQIYSPGDHSLLAFSMDGSFLASSNSGGLIEIWRFEERDGTFIPTGSIRKETVYSMAFNPSGTELAVGTTNTVYLIDPATGREMARIPHAGNVTGVSYSLDGGVLATSSLKAVQFWDTAMLKPLTGDNLVNEACSRLKANFSESQWSNLFGAEDFKVLCDRLPVP